jgi:maltooligosyltrehalose synthase
MAMATKATSPLLQHVRSLLDGSQLQQSTDRQLLDRYVSQRDQAAFAKLVERHGPLVFRVCQLLSRLDVGQSPAARRLLWAVRILEYLGTSAAEQQLQKLARGVPEARLTQEAKAALERLAGASR